MEILAEHARWKPNPSLKIGNYNCKISYVTVFHGERPRFRYRKELSEHQLYNLVCGVLVL